jgi:hypothetical protein
MTSAGILQHVTQSDGRVQFVALLRVGGGRHGPVSSAVSSRRSNSSGTMESVRAGVTATRAGKCRMSVETAPLALNPPHPTRPSFAASPECGEARVQRRDRLGGVVREYVLAA